MDQVEQGDDRTGGPDHGYGEEVTPDTERAQPGDIVRGTGWRAMDYPIVGKDESTPLEEDESEGPVPPSPLWAMKLHRHIQWHLLPAHERHRQVRDVVGTGDDQIFVIDDGAHHVMLGRRVGARAGECEYCLVGRVPRQRYEDLQRHAVAPAEAFAGAAGLTLCGVAEVDGILSSNVFDVARYADAADIPPEYRPGSPFLRLDQDLEITAD